MNDQEKADVEIRPNQEQKEVDIGVVLATTREQFRKSAQSWKLAFRVFLILAALLSTSSAIVGKLYIIGNKELAGDISAILAGLAAVSTAVVASLNFENFWRSNQKAREKVRALELEVLKSKTTDAATIVIIDKLQKIIDERAGSLLKDD